MRHLSTYLRRARPIPRIPHDGTMLFKISRLLREQRSPSSFYEHDVWNAPWSASPSKRCSIADGVRTLSTVSQTRGAWILRMHEERTAPCHHQRLGNRSGIFVGSVAVCAKNGRNQGQRETTLPQTALFEWGPGGARRQYVVRKSLSHPSFMFFRNVQIFRPHPFHYLAQDALFGLTIFYQ